MAEQQINYNIDITKPRYDQGTYLGRVLHFAAVTNPKNIFVTNKKLQSSIELLQAYKNRTLQRPVTEEELWKAKNIVESVIHPVTEKKILLPFRMSAFVPMNVAIIAGMLQARNIAPTVFWQSVNQTYNVCLNYSNGNNRVPPKELGMSYIGALVTSVGTAVGLNEWIKRATFTPAMKNILLGLVPLTAVSAANVFNISFMRMNEITHGITVKDEEGNAVGTSKIAGKKAVFTTIVSRVALVAPGMILPNFVMDFLEKKKAFVKYPWMRTPVYLTTIAVIIGIALPLCIGLFPQTAEVPVTKLEPEFHDLKNSRGEKIEKLYFNKGL